jgi:hypothetical protein
LDKPCRALLLEGLGKVLQLGGATSVSLDHVPHEFIHIDKVKEKHYYGKEGKAFPPQLKEVGVSTP